MAGGGWMRVFYFMFVLYHISLPCLSWSYRVSSSSQWADDGERYRDNKYKSSSFDVTVDTDTVKHIVDRRFLSVGYSAKHALRHPYFDYKSEVVRTLAAGLAPAIFRVGGRSADEIYFSPDNQSLHSNSISNHRQGGQPPIMNSFSGAMWKELNEFCNATGLDSFFDFNLLLRDGDRWDPTNAKMLLDYNAKLGHNVMWHLGNEPNLFSGNYGMSMSGRHVGKAFNDLRRLLSEDRYRKNNFLVGPDITHLHLTASQLQSINLTAYLENFLNEAGSAINATSLHFYNIRRYNTTTPDAYTDPKMLDLIRTEIERFNEAVREAMPTGSRAHWITESSPCTDGGLEASAQYVAGFILLNNLGTAASMDVSVLVYWNFVSSAHYSLLDTHHGFRPHPSYWIFYLHKKLVGRKVLSVSPLVVLDPGEGHLSADTVNLKKYVRVFAHCTRETSSYPNGSVTIIAINMLNDSHASLNLLGRLAGKAVDEYHLSPHGGHLNSSFINLNGEKLEMVNNTTFPDIAPRKLPAWSMITLSPMTYGYYVIPDAGARPCYKER